MGNRYRHTEHFSIAGTELEARISFKVHPGDKGDRINPPSEPQAEIQSVEIVVRGEKHDCPQWLHDLLSADLVLHDEMLGSAAEEDEARADEASDMRAEDRRLGL